MYDSITSKSNSVKVIKLYQISENYRNRWYVRKEMDIKFSGGKKKVLQKSTWEMDNSLQLKQLVWCKSHKMTYFDLTIIHSAQIMIET